MNEPRLRIGLAGCGRWGRNILRDLVNLDCSVHVADPDPEARHAAVDAGAVLARPDPTAITEDIQGWIIACPTALHAEVIMPLLAAEVPIFCEKPLAPSSEDCQRIAEAAGERVYVMDKWRYHPGIDALAKLVSSGELGQIQRLRTRRVQWGQPHTDVDGSWILLPHDISICHHILGHLPSPEYVLGDWTGNQLDGVLAILGSEPTAVLEVSSREPLVHRQISVTGSRGSAWLPDPLADHILVHSGPPDMNSEPEKRPISTEMPLLRELRSFRDHLLGGPPPLSNAWTALEHVRCMETLRLMATRDGPVAEGELP